MATWQRDKVLPAYEQVVLALRAMIDFAGRSGRAGFTSPSALDEKMLSEWEALRTNLQMAIHKMALVSGGRTVDVLREGLPIMPHGEVVPDRRRTLTRGQLNRIWWGERWIASFTGMVEAAMQYDLRDALGRSSAELLQNLELRERDWEHALTESDTQLLEADLDELRHIAINYGLSRIDGAAASDTNRFADEQLARSARPVAASLVERQPPMNNELAVAHDLPTSEERAAMRWAIALASTNFRGNVPPSRPASQGSQEYVLLRSELRGDDGEVLDFPVVSRAF